MSNNAPNAKEIDNYINRFVLKGLSSRSKYPVRIGNKVVCISENEAVAYHNSRHIVKIKSDRTDMGV